jgi:hypothetical protein
MTDSETTEPVIGACVHSKGSLSLRHKWTRSLQLICRPTQHYGKRQATFLYCALRLKPLDSGVHQLTFQAMVNREVGNPDVLDPYLGPDITAA